MKKNLNPVSETKDTRGERGAAMVMVLLVAFLLLVASAGVLLESALNSGNVTDATAEQQAFIAAESGIQRTLNVLRGNTYPSVLLNPTLPPDHKDNQIDFKRAINLATSNLPGDTSTHSRLSRWMAYDSTRVDRIALGPDAGNYAYAIEIIDPDNTTAALSFETKAVIGGNPGSYTVGSGPNGFTISYAGTTVNNLNVSSGSASSQIGKFVVSVAGSGATMNDDIRFGVEINMKAPYVATRILRGTIKKGTITSSSVGTVQVQFDSLGADLMGSDITLASKSFSPNPPNTNGGERTVSATFTPAEPIRLLIRSTGYGPRGSTKRLDAVVRKNFFDGMPAPATLTLIGGSSGFTFNPGSSNVTEVSGEDVAVPDTTIPPIGTTTDANLAEVIDSIDGLPPHPYNGTVVGAPANISAEVPVWLSSPTNLHARVQSLRDLAIFSGRYFPSGTTPATFGDNVNATGITFCDGNVAFTGAGGGILIVTGTLTLQGNFNFNGLIIVTGPGGVKRQGAGNGVLQGNVVVAPYDPNNLLAGFGAPIYDLSGGGSSTITYNSSSVANGQVAVSNIVMAVAEK